MSQDLSASSMNYGSTRSSTTSQVNLSITGSMKCCRNTSYKQWSHRTMFTICEDQKEETSQAKHSPCNSLQTFQTPFQIQFLTSSFLPRTTSKDAAASVDS